MSFGQNSNTGVQWDTRTVSNMGSFSYISNASKRPEYSIQSVPHSLEHAKTAYRDYFNNVEDD